MFIPTFIPSKNKPVNKTGQLLKGQREYSIFTDPSQVEAYREHHANVVSIEEDNLGIGYSRRFIQDYANRNNVPISWILDDDFISLHRIPDRKNVPTENGGAAILSEAEDAVLTEEFLNLTPPVGAAHFDFFVPADIARNPKSFSFGKVPVMGLLVIWDRVREAKAEYDGNRLLLKGTPPPARSNRKRSR